jgi:hypothetical protein
MTPGAAQTSPQRIAGRTISPMANPGNCSLKTIAADTHCAGERVRWVFYPSGNADKGLYLVVCEKHAAAVAFADALRWAMPHKVGGSSDRTTTKLRTTPETRALKITPPPA